MVAEITIAVASSGMSHAEALTRAVFGVTSMKPTPNRSSASRHGWTGSYRLVGPAAETMAESDGLLVALKTNPVVASSAKTSIFIMRLRTGGRLSQLAEIA